MQCSIDGLLDRTVKHMLFLRSVADQAGKLKQWVDKEVGQLVSCVLEYFTLIIIKLFKIYNFTSSLKGKTTPRCSYIFNAITS